MTVSGEKWEKLAEALQMEAAIMGYRNTGENLKKLYLQGLAVIKQDESGNIVTFGGLWPTPEANCLEAGSFWVQPLHRDKKYSSWMFRELSKIIPISHLAMCITHVEKVAHLLIKSGWQEAMRYDWQEVVPFAASCGPCDVVTDEEKITCPFMATKKDCRMFYKVG
jgi:hypothetical protein